MGGLSFCGVKFENRINLFVLLLVILLAIPGGYKLFMKQLGPESNQMFLLPPAVHRTIAYNAPMPVPPTIQRVVPARTAAWVASLAQGRTGAGQVAMHGWPTPGLEPLASRFQVFQVVAIERAGAGPGLKLSLIVWHADAPADPKAYELVADYPGATTRARVTAASDLELPEAVRNELQDNNFIDPPRKVIWLTAEVPKPAGAKSDVPLGFRLTFESEGAEGEAINDAVAVGHEPPVTAMKSPPVGFPAEGFGGG